MTEATKWIGQKSVKGGTKDFFLFDSWFDYKKASESAMELGDEFIGVVKTNTKGFCKETIKKLTKYCLGGYYLVLRIKPMVPGGRPLISIGYKYNGWKVLFFIAISDAGSTKAGITYLYKYPGPFNNVSI